MYTVDRKNDTYIFTDSTELIKLNIPKDQFADIVTPVSIPGITNNKLFEEAICKPAYGACLYNLAKEMNAKSASIIVSDVTRNVPTQKVAKYIINELIRAGMEADKVVFVIALGVHRAATENEIAEILGEDLYASKIPFHVINHDAFDNEKLTYLGETTHGTKLEVNKEAYECDLHINIGKVEPHEFAGFSGGRKSVMPGISSAKSIIANHSPKMLASPNAIPGNLKNNPIHQDMLECANLYRIDFSVNFVVNDMSEPVAVFSGKLMESHLAAIDYLRKKISISLNKPDIIITTPGYPLNVEFYQSLKPLIALTDILNEDIIVAIYSQCPEGINSEDMMRAFKFSNNLDEINDFAIKNYQIQMDHVLLLMKILKKRVKIIAYSPNINADDFQSMHMIPCSSPDDIIPLATSLSNKEKPQILIYPQAQKYLTTMRSICS